MSDPDDSAGDTSETGPSESGEPVTQDDATGESTTDPTGESIDESADGSADDAKSGSTSESTAGSTTDSASESTTDTGSDSTADPTAGSAEASDPETRDATGVEAAPNVESILEEEKLGRSRRLDPDVRYQWIVGSLTGVVIGGVLAGIALQFLASTFELYDADGTLPFGVARLTMYLAVLAAVIFLILAAVRAVLYYRSWRYEVRSDSLYLTRGVLTRVQTVAPYVRVQHVDTRRSPVERLLGLSSLVVYTAGSRGADVTIPGLTDDRAAELQSHLKRLAIASEEEDAV